MTITQIKTLEYLKKTGMVEWLRELGATGFALGDLNIQFAPISAQSETEKIIEALAREDEDPQKTTGRYQGDILGHPDLGLPSLPDYPEENT